MELHGFLHEMVLDTDILCAIGISGLIVAYTVYWACYMMAPPDRDFNEGSLKKLSLLMPDEFEKLDRLPGSMSVPTLIRPWNNTSLTLDVNLVRPELQDYSRIVHLGKNARPDKFVVLPDGHLAPHISNQAYIVDDFGAPIPKDQLKPFKFPAVDFGRGLPQMDIETADKIRSEQVASLQTS